MPSFDVVSELNLMEVENAFHQARKEIGQRFDFKGTSTDLERQPDGTILVKASAEGRLDAALTVLMEKLAKRGVALEGLDPQGVEPAAGGHVRKLVRLRRGLQSEDAKRIVALVKGSGLKLQAAIQGEAVRITGKKRDDLQAGFRKLAGFDRLGQTVQDRLFNELVVANLVLIMLVFDAPDLRVADESRDYLTGVKKRIPKAYVQNLKDLGIETKIFETGKNSLTCVTRNMQGTNMVCGRPPWSSNQKSDPWT